MKTAGSMLKRVRQRLNLRYRDVEESSHAIARRHNNDEFVIALSRLADIENKGTPPSLYRLYSLCAIYRLDLMEVLKWYGIPAEQLTEDGMLCRQPATHLMPYDGGPNGNGSESIDGVAPNLEKTSVLPRTQHAGWLEQSMLGGSRKKSIRFGIIGEDDESMAPIIPPGSVVVIDDSRKRIQKAGWKSEMERPIYFLESRDGFLCRWCTVQDGELIAIPHPSSNLTPKRYRFPAEIDVVGEVMGIAMQRPRARLQKARS